MAETNETIVCLEHCRDIYKLNPNSIDMLIDVYDKSEKVAGDRGLVCRAGGVFLKSEK